MVRLTMLLGNQEFEDNRVTFKEWPDLKSQMPLQALPVAEINGKEVSQSMAMVRYFGKLSGLYPEDAWKALLVDQIVETVMDMQDAMFSFKGDDKDAMREAREKTMKDDVPRYWGGAEKMLEDYPEGPYVLGDELSIADICIAVLYAFVKAELLDFIPKNGLEGYPKMEKILHSVVSLPEVKEWYTKHPVANFEV